MKNKLISIVLTLCLMFTFVSTASAASVSERLFGVFDVQSVEETTVIAEEIETTEKTDNTEETKKAVTLKMPERFLTMYYGSTTKLHAKASEGTVVYTSSDTSVVTVDENGNLEAVGRGNAVITARVAGTNVTQRCEIVVEFTWQHWFVYIFFFGFLWL